MPVEVPDEYPLGSPLTHVDPYCPPTLLLQGADDFIVCAEAVRLLADRLRQVGVPVVHVEYPQTDHAFDLILPRLSPAAQAALYETERFLALLTTMRRKNGRNITVIVPRLTTLDEPTREKIVIQDESHWRTYG